MTSEALTAPTPNRGRAVTITLWIAQTLMAALFAYSALSKLFGEAAAVESFDQIGFGQWFRYLVGALELAGAVGLLIPRLSGLAALGLAGVMVGAVLTHLFLIPPAVMALIPAILITVFGLIAWGRWPQTTALVPLLRR